MFIVADTNRWNNLYLNRHFPPGGSASTIECGRGLIVSIYILIRDGYPFSAFPAHLHLQIYMPTSFLSSYLAASAKSAITLFWQIVTLSGITLPISYNVYGPFREHLGRIKNIVVIVSHNDVRRLCWHAGTIFVLLAEHGLQKPPIAETPKGSVCWEKKACNHRHHI